jgi:hypothetical protein
MRDHSQVTVSSLAFMTTRFALGVSLMATQPAAMGAPPAPLTISVTGANGAGQTDQPGVPCSSGGSGASWQYDYGAAIPGGVFSALPGDVGLHLDLHSEGPTYSGAWLPTGQSYVVIENARGVLPLDLTSGSGACGENSFAFDGTVASGSGTFEAGEGSGSYREATGSGVFTLIAQVAPGSNNPFQLQMNGTISVLEPSLEVEVVSASWKLSDILLDPSWRTTTVVYRVTNAGPGDAFGVRLVGSTSPTPNVQALGSVPKNLGDLSAGESVLLSRGYRFFEETVCSLVIFGCEFDAILSVELPDALDQPKTDARRVHVRVADLPQP